MRLARKYPTLLVLTTVCVAASVFFTLLEVLKTSIEREIIKRGDMAAQSFAELNGPLLLALGSASGGEKTRLEYNLMAFGSDPDVVNARVADHHGHIITSLAREEVGSVLPPHFTDRAAPTVYADPARRAYHFRADIRYGDDALGVFVLSLSREPLETAMRRARERALIFTVGIAAAICIFGIVIVQRAMLPLKVMIAKLTAIAQGDFTERMRNDRNDEIGEVGRAFDHMLDRTELFFHYVDKMVVERLLSDETLAKPGGRKQELAVIFGDMRGYTAMSNRRSADEVVRIVNTYFHLFVECIASFRGIVDKTMGDAIMAFFERREKETNKEHVQRSLRALTYMKAASRVLNKLLRERIQAGQDPGIEPREFGFAMALGQAIVGNIGSQRRMDYTVCGRVVNLASRLEGLTKSGEVIIDNFTCHGSAGLVQEVKLAPVQPKGFSAAEAVVPHRIIGVSDEELRRMRAFLRRLFGFNFVQGVLMPNDIAPGEQRSWCDQTGWAFDRIILETSPAELFARVNPETGEILSDDPPPA